ncbi:dermonecrotic toxin domain-containing protein [Pseudomonas sp. GXZC]|uniref:dermonecrotic toxin domain-containing protein n=1 Tax=Pseudomonas sp. GXZC TaxID=3003351 RepID=UPI0022AA8ED9|nr:DUF6543 domain-containing protein [Pseudomonas sp. GXZC]WAT29423.1 NEL-type E3 ubiquitin ligase domain-containing protein [Pseudomonas sp. GXZC]
MPTTPATSTLPPALPGEQGQHYSFIKQTIPDCLVKSSPERREALKQTTPEVPDWYDKASQPHKDELKALLQARCESLNLLEKTLRKALSLVAFAQPLLETALKTAGHELDVNLTWLRLYSPFKDAFGLRKIGFKVKTYSLLQAALSNFNADEAKADYYNSASGFITQPDARQLFERHATTLSIEAFVKLCRELDLGAQYQAYLERFWHPADTVAEGVLREQYIRHQQDAFAAAALMALVKGDINDSDYALLQRVHAGEQTIKVGNKHVWYRTPCMMNLHLQGCLVIWPSAKLSFGDELIAYIPDDPEHPIKRYDSLSAFKTELTARLSAKTDRMVQPTATPQVTDFQQFFSQFIAYKDRPYYFRRLTELVADAPPPSLHSPWWSADWQTLAMTMEAPELPINTLVDGGPQATVRVPINVPNFGIELHAIRELWEDIDLWPQRFEDVRKRALDDARAQAICTADADAAASASRLQHYLNLGLLVVNTIAMVIPPLGVAMSVVMAGQLLYEVFEGVSELSKGDREAGWAHINDVMENLVFLAGGAAVHFTASSFIENLKAVTLPSGKTRLWKPDLAPYEHPRALLQGTQPNERGIHTISGEQVIALEDKRFKVRHEPATDRYVIQHPSRVDAYEPTLKHNEAGAWHHELERPQTWEGAKLMRRLGPVVEGFSEAVLEQIRTVSGVEDDVLRRLHVDSEPVPAILLDTIRQFRAYDSAMKVAQGIGDGALPDDLCSYPASLAVELPGWPPGKAIEAFAGDELSGPSVKYGAADALPADTLRIERNGLMTGQLPKRIVEFLDPAQRDQLAGRYSHLEPQAQINAVRAKLQERANLTRARLMRSLYVDKQPPTDVAERLIQRDFKNLPTLMVREMLADVTAAERQILNQGQRIPLRVAEQARRLQQQLRLTLAYEGLHLDALANRDTEALVLNTLPNLPGWSDNLRLEVREGGLEGELRAGFGPETGDKKILVRVADGRYQAFDDRGQQLHGVNGLYGALQHALPDAHRTALGVPHVGQGERLQVLIRDNALPREHLRRVLGMQPERRPFFRWPQRLSGNRVGYSLSGRGAGQGMWQQVLEERVRTLYPAFTQEQLRTFIENLGQDQEPALRRLEDEFKQLSSRLQSWRHELSQGVNLEEQASDAFRARRYARRIIAKELIEAWQRTGTVDVNVIGEEVGQFIDLADEELQGELSTLPPLSANFDHVTRLDLSNTGLSQNIDAALGNFKRLRRLDLSNNDLTALPASVGGMRHLTDLDLSDNDIVLTAESVNQLSELTRLGYLSLESNPLTIAPDIGRMPELVVVTLENTGIDTWPTGVFDQPRGRTFNLDLSANRLETIPLVEPGSDAAEIIARTTISEEPAFISAENLEQVREYRASVGLDPHRRSPPRGMLDTFSWRTGLDDAQFQHNTDVWELLEEEVGSEPFFDELRKLADSADAVFEDDAARIDLTRKVWEMIEAMANNAQLRERIFSMAAAPTTCVDAGAQVFNAMGLEVLIDQAYDLYATDLIEARLLELARGKSRLDELGRIARARIGELLEQGRKFPEYDADGHRIPHRDSQGNLLRDIDEVEVHMMYPTRLAESLELPWQSRNMMFPEADVSDEMIENARKRVLALEDGPLLQQQIIDQPFWVDFVKRANPESFEAFSRRAEALLDLEDTSPGSYETGLSSIVADEQAEVLKLTREAMQRAKLQRVEIPFQLATGNGVSTQNRK